MAGAVSSSERFAGVYFYTHAPGLPAFIGLDLLWLDYVHEPLFFSSSFSVYTSVTCPPVRSLCITLSTCHLYYISSAISLSLFVKEGRL